MKKLISLVFLVWMLLGTQGFADTTHYALTTPNIGNTTNWGLTTNANWATIDTDLWAASNGTEIGVNTASSATTITLTNPLNNVQKITFTATSQKLVLSAMNATASMVAGGTITVINAGSNAFQIVAQDGSTNVLTSLPAGQTAFVQLLSGGTANGTFNVFTAPTGVLLAVNDLSDVQSASTSRTNLGLGTAAVEDTSTIIPDDGAGNLTIGAGQVTGAMISSSAALPNGVTATTQSAGDNTTKVATDAFVLANLTPIPFSAISGFLPTSQTFTNSTNASMTITAGQATDSTNAVVLAGGAYSWNITNGNAANGYHGGTILPNSSTIRFFICSGASGTTSFADNQDVARCPTGYAVSYRRLFSIPTDSSGTLLEGTPIEVEGGAMLYYLSTQVLDVSVTNLGSSSRTLYTLSVPIGIKVEPIYRAVAYTNPGFILTSPDEADVATPAYGTFTVPLTDWGDQGVYVATALGGQPLITNTSGQIGARASSGSSNYLYLTTRGWKDFRRN